MSNCCANFYYLFFQVLEAAIENYKQDHRSRPMDEHELLEAALRHIRETGRYFSFELLINNLHCWRGE